MQTISIQLASKSATTIDAVHQFDSEATLLQTATEVEITDQEALSKGQAETLETRSKTNEENLQMMSMEMQIFDEDNNFKTDVTK